MKNRVQWYLASDGEEVVIISAEGNIAARRRATSDGERLAFNALVAHPLQYLVDCANEGHQARQGKPDE